MISVLSRQPRLSGSNIFFLLLICLTLSACDAFKKAQTTDRTTQTNNKDDKEELDEIQGKTRYNPKTGKYEVVTDVTQEMDTIKWTKADPEKTTPPITSEGIGSDTGNPTGDGTAPDGANLSSYNVAILMPFLTDRYASSGTSQIDDKSSLALNFYSGAKMALDELGNRGVRLNISVMDTKASESETRRLLSRPEVQNANLIIGPVRTSNLQLVSDFSKRNFIPMVSPISPSIGPSRGNPYYLQAAPSLAAHINAITKHAKNNYSTDQLVLVCRNKAAEVNRLKIFQRANEMIEGSSTAEKIKELIVTDQSADLNELDITPYIKEGETTVFMIPSWSNESFIYSFMRKVNIAKGKNEVVIYGMPQWMDFNLISYDYYEQLNLHISSAYYVDEDSDKVRQFRKDFFNKYGAPPTKDAFVGYDVVKYFGQMISDHGTRFQDVIDNQDIAYLQSKFDFERVPVPGITAENDADNIDHYENEHVNILMFEDYYFQPAY